MNLDSAGNSRNDALPDIRVGNKSNGGLALELSKALVIEEEKQFLFSDRPSQRGAELIPAKRRPGRIEEVARIQNAVAQKLVNRTMIGIRTRLRSGIHNSAIASELRAVRTGQHLNPGESLD